MKRFFKLYLAKPELAGLFLLVVLAIIFEVQSGGVFFSQQNLRGLLGILPEIALVAIGVTILMICGEFDLSVGSVFALMPMSMAVVMSYGFPFAVGIAAGFGVCILVGLVNGILTLRFSIPSFIVTLGMLFIARSLTVVISGGFPPLLPADIPSWIFTQFTGPQDLFRYSFFWFLGVAVFASLMLSRTNLGNWIKATGGFNEAARSMGIPSDRVKIFCFVLCSVLAGMGGLIQVLRLGSPLPSIGTGLELQAVAAAVIGGTALTGGVGTVLGGIVGALLIRVIDNGLVLSQVNANWFQFAVGGLTIFAVIVNSWLRSKSRGIRVETDG